MPEELSKEDEALLESWIGEFVRVAITHDGFSRDHFGPQISVAGTLERHKDSKTSYRVVADDDCFTYFTPAQVVLVNPLCSVPTIMLSIPVTEEVEALK